MTNPAYEPASVLLPKHYPDAKDHPAHCPDSRDHPEHSSGDNKCDHSNFAITFLAQGVLGAVIKGDQSMDDPSMCYVYCCVVVDVVFMY